MKVIPAIATLLVICPEIRGYFLRGKRDMEVRRHRVFRKRYLTGQDGNEAEQSGEEEDSTSSFGTELFSELCAELPPESNVLISPLSVYQALALTKAGATVGSDNEEELQQILGSEDIEDEYLSLQEQAENNDPQADVQLTMATSIWADNLKPSYVDMAHDDFSAEAMPLPARYTPVDEWIEKKTKGMIKDMMGGEKLDPLTVALLVNAVWFKGIWTHEFDPSETTEGTFYLHNDMPERDLDKPQRQVPVATNGIQAKFMRSHSNMKVIQESLVLGNASAVIMDYGKQTSGQPAEFTSMFILPASNSIDSMNNVVSGLEMQSISDLFEEAQSIDVRLALPRFRLNSGTKKLKSMLESMGMEIAFDINVAHKFDQMSVDPDLYVEDVHHSACMEVTEEGTEASAATVVEIRTRTARPRVYSLTFDRPFVVIVLHRPTGIPLFIGRVENPDFSF